MLLSYNIPPIPYKQILQRTEGLKKMGYKVSWLLNDVDYCHIESEVQSFSKYVY